MEISGKIIAILGERNGVSQSGRNWKVAQYVIETIEQYPKRMVFEVFGEDKISMMNIQAGEGLTVSFDIDAHEYKGRWYNQIRAWKVERQQETTIQDCPPHDITEPLPPMPETDVLPF